MDARRLELYELLKPTLGEKPARRLLLELGPDRERVATKDDLVVLKDDLVALKDDLIALEVRLDAKLDARLERLENVLTRRMVAILGSWTVLVGSAFAWASVLLR